MQGDVSANRYSIFARGVCVAAPRRNALSFWIHAHSPRGHGIHSQLLYTLCREVFFTLFRQKKRNSYSGCTALLMSLLQAWWVRNPTRVLRRVSEPVCIIDDVCRLEEVYRQVAENEASTLPPIVLVCRPRRNRSYWQTWCHLYRAMPHGVVIDLYTWGLLLSIDNIALHKFAVRGFIRCENFTD